MQVPAADLCSTTDRLSFGHCVKNPNCIYTMKQLDRCGSCTLNCGLWREGLKEGCCIDAATSSASCLILSVQVAKHDPSWILHNPRQGWLTPLPAHTQQQWQHGIKELLDQSFLQQNLEISNSNSWVKVAVRPLTSHLLPGLYKSQL